MNQKKIDAITLCIILHAHLPYVRNKHEQFPLEELWLYQNIAECYIPIILVCHRLLQKNINPSITISISPTLAAMLSDHYYISKFKQWCKAILHALDILKTKKAVPDNTLSFYTTTMHRVMDYICNNSFISDLSYLGHHNAIEIITTAGTHPFFPLFRNHTKINALQIVVGLSSCTKHFAVIPQGFWLPELGYFYGLDNLFIHHNIKYTIVNDSSLLLSESMPSTGNFYPVKLPSGLVAFPRDAVLSMKIWSATEGYPGHPYYREFHRDAMYLLQELSHTYPKTLGLKLYAITGNDDKYFYDPIRAQETVHDHVADFVDAIVQRAHQVWQIIHKPPVFILPFDAELFGHWWFEGPLFLELLLEKLWQRNDIRCTMLKDLLTVPIDTTAIVESSWGKDSNFSTWYNNVVRHYIITLDELLYHFEDLISNNTLAVQQCARELLLAMASDWLFMISNNICKEYATQRLEDHLSAASILLKMIDSKNEDIAYIQNRFEKYPIFSDMEHLINATLKNSF